MQRKIGSLIFLLIFLCVPHVSFSLELPGPITIYLTWQRDPTTTMVVQWVTDLQAESDEVHYQKKGDEEWKVATGTHVQMPRNQPYLIHRVELNNLSPEEAYYFTTGEWKSVSHKFRTMPRNPDKPFRFVVGGDMYGNDISYMIQTNKQAAAKDPMFALLGGDLAYAAEKSAKSVNPEEAKKWVMWLKTWTDNAITPDGYMIPFIPAIGNHDTEGRYDQTPDKAPFFYTLFAFPGKQGYNVLDFGNYLSLVVLDSGHTHPIGGNQAKWLYQALEQRRNIPHKFALYHVGAYPSVRKYNGPYARKIREAWVPSFEKFHLSAAFEHHDHAYKRTVPILRGRKNPEGVVYIGDGAWGVNNLRKPLSPTKLWYLAVSKQSRNFTLVTIDGNKRNYQGIDPTGKVIDSY